ncbi:hypothetical protein FB107DRAFT_277488 [Schizophyllum commune]
MSAPSPEKIASLGPPFSREFASSSVVLFAEYPVVQALKRLAQLPPQDTAHLIQDVGDLLFGTPVSGDPAVWTGIRRWDPSSTYGGCGESSAIAHRREYRFVSFASTQPTGTSSIGHSQTVKTQHLWRPCKYHQEGPVFEKFVDPVVAQSMRDVESDLPDDGEKWALSASC